jgi:hypothetical protein
VGARSGRGRRSPHRPQRCGRRLLARAGQSDTGRCDHPCGVRSTLLRELHLPRSLSPRRVVGSVLRPPYKHRSRAPVGGCRVLRSTTSDADLIAARAAVCVCSVSPLGHRHEPPRFQAEGVLSSLRLPCSSHARVRGGSGTASGTRRRHGGGCDRASASRPGPAPLGCPVDGFAAIRAEYREAVTAAAGTPSRERAPRRDGGRAMVPVLLNGGQTVSRPHAGPRSSRAAAEAAPGAVQ